MQILIVTERLISKDMDLTPFRDLAEPSEIEVCNVENAKIFITKLIEQKKHLDFIIISKLPKNEFHFFNYNKKDEEIEFCKWIRDSKETYSSDNFQLSAIPIILDDGETLFRSSSVSFKNVLFDFILDLNELSKEKYFDILGCPINKWLHKLGTELDRVGLDCNFIFEKSIVPSKDSFDTEILSQGFFRRQQKLDYLWIGDNIKQLYVDIDRYSLLLKQSARKQGLRNEKEYHRFMLNNKGLFLTEHYKSTVYEHHFYYNSSMKYVEPDFINLAWNHSLRRNEIFEQKLPNQRLFSPKTNGISRYFKNSLNQINIKYRNYYTDTSNETQIRMGLGFVPKSFDYTLLIGRDDDLEENKFYLEVMNAQAKIVTYDGLLENYQRVYRRVKRFGLR